MHVLLGRRGTWLQSAYSDPISGNTTHKTSVFLLGGKGNSPVVRALTNAALLSARTSGVIKADEADIVVTDGGLAHIALGPILRLRLFIQDEICLPDEIE